MITELSVKNYRSLKDMHLSLGPLVVLIGANGSGKSNILDVLKLLRELVVDRKQVDDVLAPRGGYGEVVWGGDTTRDIEIGLNWHAARSEDNVVWKYSIGFGPERSQTEFRTEYLATSSGESVTRNGPSQYSFRNRSGSKFGGSSDHRESVLDSGGVGDLGAMGALSSPNLFESMNDWAFYRFNPELMRPPQPVRKEYRLVESGENLSTVVHALFSDRDPALNEIVDVLKACVRTVEDLVSPIYGDAQTYVALKEKSVPSPVGSWGLSDGTLLSLALATALVTPDRPSLIALEAPDIELHPYVMQTLAEMLTIASEDTQVVVTTHSPYLLDFLPPESFVVVEKNDGATTCRSLRDEKDVQEALAELGAGTVWHSGDIGGVP